MRYYYITPEDYRVAEKNGISAARVYQRVYRSGWDVERAITEKPLEQKLLWTKWKNRAKMIGVDRTLFWSRYKEGWPPELIVTTIPGISRWDKWKIIAKRNGVSKSLFYKRIREGYSDKEAAKTLIKKELPLK